MLNFVSLLLAFSIDTVGNNYYLDNKEGLDSNTGTSAGNAWKSYAAIIAHSFNSGDTVFFKCGSIFNGAFQFNSSGVNGTPIVLTSYGTGTNPILTNPGESYALQLTGSWVIVENFLILNTCKSGIEIIGGAEHHIIRNCEFTNVGLGLLVYGKNNTITNNYIHDLHMVVNTPGGDDDYGATGIFLFAGNNEISYNTFTHCSDTSSDYGHDGGAVDFCVNVDSSIVHHNYAEECNGFFEFGAGAANDNTIVYNISVNNSMFGALNLSGKYACVINNLHIENNTIIETGNSGMSYIILWFSAPEKANTIYFQNNIVYFDNYYFFSNDSSFTHRNNLYYYHLYPYTELGFTLSAGETIAEPLFEDVSFGNYHLTYNSPAKDAGLNLGAFVDFDGVPVPFGMQTDIGAYEYYVPSNVKPLHANSLMRVYPNPASNKISIEYPAIKKDAIISIYNMQGKLLLQQMIRQERTELDISRFAKGVYIIELGNKDKIEVTSFVKK